MTTAVSRAISGMRATLSLVVLCQALHFALSRSGARDFPHFGLPLWMGQTLAWSEVAGALLFLVPSTRLMGGYALLVIFVFALAVHVYGGDWGVGTLLVYLTATIVALAQARTTIGDQK
jgi:hypothetical protein